MRRVMRETDTDVDKFGRTFDDAKNLFNKFGEEAISFDRVVAAGERYNAALAKAEQSQKSLSAQSELTREEQQAISAAMRSGETELDRLQKNLTTIEAAYRRTGEGAEALARAQKLVAAEKQTRQKTDDDERLRKQAAAIALTSDEQRAFAAVTRTSETELDRLKQTLATVEAAYQRTGRGANELANAQQMVAAESKRLADDALRRTVNGVELTEEEYRQLNAVLRQTDTELDHVSEELRQATALHQRGALSLNRLEDVQRRYNAALNAAHPRMSLFNRTMAGGQSAIGGFRNGMASLGFAGPIAGMAGLVGGAVSAHAIIHKLRSELEHLDDAGDQASKLGISFQALESLRFAAEQQGADAGTLDKGLEQLTRRISDAADGNKSLSTSFEQLGLSADSLRDMSADQQFAVVADALAGVENQSDRVRLAFEVLGRGGLGLLPAMQGGSAGIRELQEEFDRLNGTISDETIAAVGRTNDAIDKTMIAFSGLSRQTAVAISPALLAGLEIAAEYLIDARDAVTDMTEATHDAGVVIDPVTDAVATFASALDVVNRIGVVTGGTIGQIKDNVVTMFRVLGGDFAAAQEAGEKQGQAFAEAFSEPLAGDVLRQRVADNDRSTPATDRRDKAAADAANAIARMKKLNEAVAAGDIMQSIGAKKLANEIQAEYDSAKRRFDLAQKEIAAGGDQRRNVAGLTEDIDALTEAEERHAESKEKERIDPLLADAQRDIERLQDRLSFGDDTQAAKAHRLRLAGYEDEAKAIETLEAALKKREAAEQDAKDQEKAAEEERKQAIEAEEAFAEAKRKSNEEMENALNASKALASFQSRGASGAEQIIALEDHRAEMFARAAREKRLKENEENAPERPLIPDVSEPEQPTAEDIRRMEIEDLFAGRNVPGRADPVVVMPLVPQHDKAVSTWNDILAVLKDIKAKEQVVFNEAA